jgi:hypothetical protein
MWTPERLQQEGFKKETGRGQTVEQIIIYLADDSSSDSDSREKDGGK